MAAIKLRDLTRRFGSKTAVDSLNLSVDDGEIFALLGVNGAGKTTTVKMLSCLLPPSSGDALVLGSSICAQPRQVKKLINVSPQETAVAPNLTARENLELIAGVYGADRRRAAEKAQKAIERFGLGEVGNSRAKILSGGWQRRLSIAMALITEPRVLFLDEPTLGLDVLSRRALWEVIRSLRGGTTVVLTTHYLEEAEALCGRIAVIARGRLRACGTADELMALTGCDNFEDAFVRLSTEEAAS